MSKTTRRPGIGAPPNPNDAASVARWMRSVTELLQVSGGVLGDKLDSGVTWRDLKTSGFDIKVTATGSVVGTVPVPDVITDEPYTPPSAITGLTAAGGYSAIFLEWDRSDYAFLAYVEIWRAQTDNLGVATLLGTVESNFWVDSVGSGSTLYYYWVRIVSTRGEMGPWNAAFGVSAQSSLSPEYLLSVLTDQVTSSQLGVDLKADINYAVDGVESLETEVTALSGDYYSSYTVKLLAGTVNGKKVIGGFGLSSTVDDYDASVHTQALFSVDTFAIMSPGSTSLAFVVSGGKVVMDAAYIKTATITDAHISFVSANKISVGKLIGVTLSGNSLVGGQIGIGSGSIPFQYTDYTLVNGTYNASTVNTSVGFKVDTDGNVECKNIIAHNGSFGGTLTATAIHNFDFLKPATSPTTYASYAHNVTDSGYYWYFPWRGYYGLYEIGSILNINLPTGVRSLICQLWFKTAKYLVGSLTYPVTYTEYTLGTLENISLIFQVRRASDDVLLAETFYENFSGLEAVTVGSSTVGIAMTRGNVFAPAKTYGDYFLKDKGVRTGWVFDSLAATTVNLRAFIFCNSPNTVVDPNTASATAAPSTGLFAPYFNINCFPNERSFRAVII